MIHYITGGARSGKSSYAMNLAKENSKKPLYIATARRRDEEFEKRIQLHEASRSKEWRLIEEETHLSKLPLENKVAVINCFTLWLTNPFADHKEDADACLAFFKQEMNQLKSINTTLIIISNEIGMGLHADRPSGRKFTDLQGWANQYITKLADQAIFMVSGIPIALK